MPTAGGDGRGARAHPAAVDSVRDNQRSAVPARTSTPRSVPMGTTAPTIQPARAVRLRDPHAVTTAQLPGSGFGGAGAGRAWSRRCPSCRSPSSALPSDRAHSYGGLGGSRGKIGAGGHQRIEIDDADGECLLVLDFGPARGRRLCTRGVADTSAEVALDDPAGQLGDLLECDLGLRSRDRYGAVLRSVLRYGTEFRDRHQVRFVTTALRLLHDN